MRLYEGQKRYNHTKTFWLLGFWLAQYRVQQQVFSMLVTGASVHSAARGAVNVCVPKMKVEY